MGADPAAGQAPGLLRERDRNEPADAIEISAGGLDLRTLYNPPHGVGTWLQIETAHLQLAPGEAARVVATLQVSPAAPRLAGPPYRTGGRGVRVLATC